MRALRRSWLSVELGCVEIRLDTNMNRLIRSQPINVRPAVRLDQKMWAWPIHAVQLSLWHSQYPDCFYLPNMTFDESDRKV